MKIQYWLKPLIALVTSLAMCSILSACQLNKVNAQAAETEKKHYPFVSHSSNKFAANSHNNRRTYYIDGIKLEWSNLTEEQQSKIHLLEIEIDTLQEKLNIDDSAMEAWSEKMDLITDKIDIDVDALESIEVDFDGKSIALKDIEKIADKINLKSKQLEISMQALEKEMQLLESKMPVIDEKTLDAIEAKSHEIEIIIKEVAARHNH